MKGKYLITVDNFFIAPDGKYYRAVWGEVEILGDDVLGVTTNRNATNWYAKIGTADNHVIVAGCQIHYAIKSENRPNTDKVEDYNTGENGINNFGRPTVIYIAE